MVEATFLFGHLGRVVRWELYRSAELLRVLCRRGRPARREVVLMVEAAVVAAAVVAKKEGCEAAYMCSQSPLLSRTGWVPASNFTSD